MWLGSLILPKDASSQSLREADGVKIVVEPVGGGTVNLGNFTLEIRQEFDRPAEVLPTHREKRRAVQRQVHAALPITRDMRCSGGTDRSNGADAMGVGIRRTRLRRSAEGSSLR